MDKIKYNEKILNFNLIVDNQNEEISEISSYYT